MWGNECAILSFKLPFNILSRQDTFKKCIYFNPTIEWKKYVKESRLCDQKKTQYLDKFDMVYGPICANIYQLYKHDGIPKSHDPPQFQMASKSDRFDTFMTKCLQSIISLPKN